MNEARYWLRLALACLLGGGLLFYAVLNLTVKGGKVSMPDLRGQNRSAAERRLESLGLKMAVREERYSTASPFGAVLEQEFEPGAPLKRGRAVEVVLSKGTQSVAVPQLAGMAGSRQAKLMLEQNGLALGVVDAVSNSLPADAVLAQSPEAGAEVARGAAVSLLLSAGPPKRAWVMPDLKGADLGRARALAKAMGLVLRRVIEKPAQGAGAGSVLAQNLSAGARVEEGSELNLSAAEGSAEAGEARLALIEYTVPSEGFVERRCRITVTDALGSRVVFNSMAKPGERLKLEPRVRGKAAYSVSLAGAVVEEREIP